MNRASCLTTDSSSCNISREVVTDLPRLHRSNNVLGRLTFAKNIRTLPERSSSWGSNTSCSDDVSIASDERKIVLKPALTRDGGSGSRNKQSKKKVRFNLSRMRGTKIHKIPSYFQYASDLWWTHDETEQRKIDGARFSIVTNEDKAIAKMYLRAYRKGRQELYESIIARRGSIEPAERPLLTREISENLMLGRSNGFAGLEMHVKASCNQGYTVKEIVVAIVKAYKAQFSINESLESSLFKGNKNNTIDEYTSIYAQTLTELDRSWGLICGKTDKECIVGYNLDTEC